MMIIRSVRTPPRDVHHLTAFLLCFPDSQGNRLSTVEECDTPSPSPKPTDEPAKTFALDGGEASCDCQDDSKSGKLPPNEPHLEIRKCLCSHHCAIINAVSIKFSLIIPLQSSRMPARPSFVGSTMRRSSTDFANSCYPKEKLREFIPHSSLSWSVDHLG